MAKESERVTTRQGEETRQEKRQTDRGRGGALLLKRLPFAATSRLWRSHHGWPVMDTHIRTHKVTYQEEECIGPWRCSLPLWHLFELKWSVLTDVWSIPKAAKALVWTGDIQQRFDCGIRRTQSFLTHLLPKSPSCRYWLRKSGGDVGDGCRWTADLFWLVGSLMDEALDHHWRVARSRTCLLSPSVSYHT